MTDRELKNFARFIRPNPQGGFDSSPSSKPAHVARLRNGVAIREFGPGGAFDSEISAPDRAVLVKLASELSDVEWLALKRTLLGEPEDDETDSESSAPAMDAARSNLGKLALGVRQDRYPTHHNRPAPAVSPGASASFFGMFPEARRG
ncbi:hypothetical protein ACWGS9_19905 [Bradyrhizobium sp. Arg314]